tara:strand:+ start:278 stop:496 length:219 start_codon:yes stop_codon:yes gene_type:complete
MAKIINIHTGQEVLRPEEVFNDCTICECKFSDAEGGLKQGLIGMLAVSFCPTCFSGLLDMASYFLNRHEEDE